MGREVFDRCGSFRWVQPVTYSSVGCSRWCSVQGLCWQVVSQASQHLDNSVCTKERKKEKKKKSLNSFQQRGD